jgi:LysM repeat protein
MSLPSRDELRERLAAAVESLGATIGEISAGARRAFEARPHMGRALGIGAAVVVLAGVVIAVVAGQRGGSGGVGQLVVPAVTPTARPPEQTATPTVGAPPNPGAPPEPGAATPEPGAPTSAAPGPSVPTSGASAPTSGASAPGPTSTAAPSLPAEHEVVAGETLARIALRYGVPFEQIAADSGITDVNRIRPGQHLRIRPVPAGVEIIKPGRTLSDYARSSGRRVDELMRLNPGITDPDRILAGGRLHV